MFTCAIIAGGKSRRMGFDKQMLSLGEKTIFEKNMEILQKEFAEIIVVTYTPELYGEFKVKTCQDIIKGQGPLGGIHSAICHSNNPYIYAIACDMPNINQDYIRLVKGKILEGKKDALVSRYKNHIEPFHGIYGKACIKAIEEDLDKQQASIKKSLEKVNTLYIPELEVRKFTPNWDMFMNLNTRDEYERFLAI